MKTKDQLAHDLEEFAADDYQISTEFLKMNSGNEPPEEKQASLDSAEEDYFAYLKVAFILREGSFKEAYHAAWNLDTYLREGIPPHIWAALTGDDIEDQ